MAVIEVDELTVHFAVAVPNFTLVTPVKRLPVMVTLLPPAVGPDVRESEITIGPKTKSTVLLLPPGVVTLTKIVAPGGAPPGLVTVSCVPVAFTEFGSTASVPKFTEVAPVSPLPLNVNVVPPEGGPLGGEISVTDGTGYTYLYTSAGVAADGPLNVVTVMGAVPAASAGATTTTCVVDLTLKDWATVDPNCTMVVPVNPVPVMVTFVPPSTGPVALESEVTFGGVDDAADQSTDAAWMTAIGTTSTARANTLTRVVRRR